MPEPTGPAPEIQKPFVSQYTGCPKNVDLFGKCSCFLNFQTETVSETFTQVLSLDIFNVNMHLSLSFVIYAELLPLILK